MPDVLNLVEAWIYSLANLMPYLLLSIYPFRHNFRFPRFIVWMFIALIGVIQIILGTWAAFFPDTPSSIKSIVSTVIYIAFYFAVIKAHFGKMAFTLLAMSNICNMIVAVSKCIEYRILPEMAMQGYRWSFTVIMIVVEIIVLVPLYFYFKKVYEPVLNQETGQSMWRFIWVVPLTFYIVWYYIAYMIGQTLLEAVIVPGNTLFLFMVFCGSCIVYHAVISLSREQNKNLELQVKNHNLEIQTREYNTLMEKITEIRRIRHDIRHSMILMNDDLKNGRYDELEKIISEYLKNLPESSTLYYCENSTANTLISYFAQLACQNGTKFCYDIYLPADISIEDADICVLFGNILENAVDACKQIKDRETEIKLKCITDESGKIFITIDNTCEYKPKTNANGVYFSSKHKGTGIGVQSVRSIAEKYNGVFRIEFTDELCCVSIMI